MNVFIPIGTIGLFLGFLSFITFAYRRIRRILHKIDRQKAAPPGLLKSIRNLTLIIIWTSLFGILLFMGLFLRAYHVFTHETPVAEIRSQPVNGDSEDPITLVHFFSVRSKHTRYLLIRGDQWMIEGDILKWDSWLNFLGFHTRYRLTRLRGRYLDIEAEKHRPPSIHVLSEEEYHPLWPYLYDFGQRLPFVDSVYGNAAYQNLRADTDYMIYVGPTGFLVRKKAKKSSNGNEISFKLPDPFQFPHASWHIRWQRLILESFG